MGHHLHTMFDQLTSWPNLLLAFRKAAKGKRGKPAAAAFEYRLEDNLLQLQRELRRQTYQPGGYASFMIHDPKRRLISAAPFRDRVVHHALCNLIEPLFERSFIDDSYANRVGKGHPPRLRSLPAVRTAVSLCPANGRAPFFPSIDHAILLQILERKLRDPGVQRLCRQILASGAGVLDEAYDMVYFPGDDLLAALRPRGLPIGNLTSQFWANVYLNPIDHFIKRELRCKGYVRYVDDLLLFHDDSKGALWDWKEQLSRRMATQRLTLHPGSHPRPVTEGIPFLGFVIYPERRRLKRRKAIYYRRRFRRLKEAYMKREIELEDMSASVRGWANHVAMLTAPACAKRCSVNQSQRPSPTYKQTGCDNYVSSCPQEAVYTLNW